LAGRSFKMAADVGKPVSWGEHCFGYLSKWSDCSEECYQEKIFTLVSAKDCSGPHYLNNSVIYKICMGGQCPIGLGQEFSEIRESILDMGINSAVIENIGDLAERFSFGVAATILLCIGCTCFLKYFQLEWLPDVAVIIPVAAAFAMVLRFGVLKGVTFGAASNSIMGVIVSRVMNDLLLPISIFEGAYHIQRLNFWSEFGYGLCFAVVGTGMSAVFIAAMVKKTGEWGLHPVDGWRQAFAYAAFIADVDPVATLSIFSELKVDALLATLVAGEATLNDPIALVIFGICNKKEKNFDFDPATEAMSGVFLLAGSICLGLLSGLVLTASVKALRVRSTGAAESAYILLCAYTSFWLGEFVHMSGIIVALFSGLVMGIYVPSVVEDVSTVSSFLYNCARLADYMMFMLIGLCTYTIDSRPGVILGLLTIVFCFVARALMIAILVPIVNAVKKARGEPPLDFGRSFMLFHSGLRGGLTIMMALMLDPYWSEDQNVLVNATLVTVIGMTYLCGCTGPFFLKLCGVPMNVSQEDGSLDDGNHRVHTRFIRALHGRIEDHLMEDKSFVQTSPGETTSPS